MMRIHFFKYHGTGNDFILLDNRLGTYHHLSTEQIRFLCDRHFGIGADGLMLLSTQEGYDFRMTYFNSDGSESTMCGNGGRCITAFAAHLGLVSDKAQFVAIDGPHEAKLIGDQIELHMKNAQGIQVNETYSFLDTGSPHYVHEIEDVRDVDVRKEGALIRYSPRFKEEGVNVNFVESQGPQDIFVRTYERGVEDETLSCGTGVTACALHHIREHLGTQQVRVKTLGGELLVRCENKDGQHFEEVWLCGPATFVFEGNIEISEIE